MDSQDNDKITQILSKLKNNQQTIFQQLNHQFSINNDIIDKFNKTVLDIQHNEQSLLERIDILALMFKENNRNTEVLFAENVLNQIIHLMNIILNLSQNIRNSLSFCNMNILHPSIITDQELSKELIKLNAQYKDSLPFAIEDGNIRSYGKMIRPKCYIIKNEIVYFLTLPLFEPKQYRLFHLISVPNKQFHTIIPSVKYILKHESELVPLNDVCHQVDGSYLCHALSKSLTTEPCVTDILLYNKFDRCSYVQLQTDGSLEYLPDLDQYLAVLPRATTLEKKCPHSWTKKTITGVFLFDNEQKCEIRVNSNLLQFNDSSHSHPMALEFDFGQQTDPEKELPKLRIKNLRLTKLAHNLPAAQIDTIDITNWHLSGTAALYIILLISACTLAYRRFHLRSRSTPSDAEPSRKQLDSVKI